MSKTMEFNSGPDIFFRVIFSIIFSLLSVFLFLIDRSYRKEKTIKVRKYVNRHPLKIFLFLLVAVVVYFLYYLIRF
jgi:heme/copper-type cytochrome/quinol oxidase subunit 2